MASGCLFAGGAEGTGEGKDYDPSWPIESPDELPEPPKPPPVVDPCHDHNATGSAHIHNPDCPCVGDGCEEEEECEETSDPDDPNRKCKCKTNDPENNPDKLVGCHKACCGGLFGMSQAQLVLMMIASAVLMVL